MAMAAPAGPSARQDFWFGTSGPRNARIVVVGEAWGEEEAAQALPFVGQAGTLLRTMLREAGIDPEDCFFTNLIPARPAGNDFSLFFDQGPSIGPGRYKGLSPNPALMQGINDLWHQIATIKPDLVIACGNYPLWALTASARIQKATGGASPKPARPVGIGDFHGSQLYSDNGYCRILPIYHPAAILRDWPTRRLTVHDLRVRVPLALAGNWDPPLRAFIAPPSFAQATAFLVGVAQHALREKVALAVDVETKFNSILTCIGLAHRYDSAISIPFVKLDGTSPSGLSSYWPPEEEKKILQWLSLIFRMPNVSILGQNLVYDCQWFFHLLGMKPRVSFDTLIMQNLLFPGTEKDLGSLSAMYCAHHRYWKDDNHEWSNTGTLKQHLEYNCEDVVRTLEIAGEQISLAHQLGLADKIPFEMEKFELAREMNENGIRRDSAATLEAATLLVTQMQNLGDRLHKLIPQALVESKSKVPWYRSDAQIKFILYTLLRLPMQLDPKTRRPSSSKETLTFLQECFPRLRGLFQALMDYGSLDTIYSTFIKAKTEFDGKIHASFNPAGTETFRWSSSKNAFNRAGNMQNIPVGDSEEGDEVTIKKPAIRRIFTADSNYILLDCDLKGADAQIVAWEADDAQMKSDLRSGVKLHLQTAKAFFGKAFDDAPGEVSNKLTPKGKMYDDIKRTTHGTNYGASARTIAAKLGWPRDQAERFKHWWLHTLHPGIGAWHQRTEQLLRTTRTATNQFGYRIIYFDRIDGLLPEALAWQPQSTVAIVSFKGACAVRRKWTFVKFLLQVHDSIVFQIPARERHCIEELPDLLKVTVPYPDPLVIGSKIQCSEHAWGDVQEIKLGGSK